MQQSTALVIYPTTKKLMEEESNTKLCHDRRDDFWVRNYLKSLTDKLAAKVQSEGKTA